MGGGLSQGQVPEVGGGLVGGSLRPWAFSAPACAYPLITGDRALAVTQTRTSRPPSSPAARA